MKKTLLIAICLIAVTSGAIAKEREDRPDRKNPIDLFEKMDINKDGNLTKEEMNNFKNEHQKREDEHFKSIDDNNDNKISKNEFLEKSITRFEEMDLDNNGFISQQEVKQAKDRMKEEMHKHDGKRDEVPDGDKRHESGEDKESGFFNLF